MVELKNGRLKKGTERKNEIKNKGGRENMG